MFECIKEMQGSWDGREIEIESNDIKVSEAEMKDFVDGRIKKWTLSQEKIDSSCTYMKVLLWLLDSSNDEKRREALVSENAGDR